MTSEGRYLSRRHCAVTGSSPSGTTYELGFGVGLRTTPPLLS